MISKTVMSLTFAVACLAALPAARAQQPADEMVTNGPQVTPGDRAGGGSAERNNRESAQYERLLQSNRAFRMARINKECGPIADPELHATCVASFGENEPYSGSSARPHMQTRSPSAGE